MGIKEYLARHLLLADGAMGTQIQLRQPGAAAWGKYEGCNEWLNLSAPEIIRDIHAAYFAAGSDAVETNSFGASPITLGEYGLAEKAREISHAAAQIARGAAVAAATKDGRPRFVLGSVGPGTKLATLGQVSFDDLYGGCQEQMGGLLEGGADGIIVETCQDLLQIKAAVAAAMQVLGSRSDKLLYVSVTVETTGTLLVGSSIWAVLASLEPYPIDVLGMNCATGPEAMQRHLEAIARQWRGFIGCMPNAGLPTLQDGQVHYPLGPAEFTRVFAPMAKAVGLHVIGGCCGTTPEHIRELRQALGEAKAPPPRQGQAPEQVASLFAPVDLTQDPPPLYVGERANATGSKKFRDTLLAEKLDAAFDLLVEQDEGVAHVLDLSVAYAGRDEIADMTTLVARAARECRLPLMVDSTQLDVVEAALKLYGGRMLVNSINFESGEEKAEKLVALARQFGAGLVALTIDETGMAMTADRKVEIAKRLIEFCEKRGLRRGDLLIDALTFTVCSGDGALRDAAKETIAAIRRIKQEFPGVRTILGLSNVSFGLKPAARKVLNTVFLDRCIKAGMDACIINTAGLVPLTELAPAAIQLAEKLLDNDVAEGDPLELFIQHFEAAEPEAEAGAAVAAQTPEEQVAAALVKGKAALLETAIPALLAKMAAEDVLNGHLIPAMKEVGRLFNDGILQLPFVLKSAEVMKKAVALIKPHLKAGQAKAAGTLVIGTVAGDVHDIGKNLVDIILSNNGYRVVNLGVKVPVEKMLEAVRESQADMLGMSGLLVKSVQVMRENLKVLETAGLKIPVLLGGAALTEPFVRQDCQPVYSGPVRYCKDAFDSLTAFRELEETGTLAPSPPPRSTT
ncbi:MAG TPA: homocysteine S-methyltransferase family protein [Kiritimatiellia bacterium]|nr:homocysteine S-methyltransferase family protein [Kiritimatiellia bacterium]